MKSNEIIQNIAEKIAGMNRLAVLSHFDPDPDAIGAICGFALGIRGLGKEVVCLNESGCPEEYLFFPGGERIQNEWPETEFDGIVICDCGDRKRVGDLFLPRVESANSTVINIDHHYSNDGFGDINLVVGAASSTCELIYELFEAMKVEITEEIAFCLLAGISGDTGSFRYSSTSARTFQIAQCLTDAGALPQQVAEKLYGRVKLSALKLKADALMNLQTHFDGRVSEVLVTEEMYTRHDATSADTDQLVERARDIEGVLISIAIRAHEGLWRVSLRSKDERYAVSEVAQSFGGGGHKAAAAFRSRKPLDQLRQEILDRLRELLGE